MPAGEQLCPFRQSDLHIPCRSLNLVWIHLRTNLDRLIQPVANSELAGPRHELRGELLRDALLQQDAAGSRAALSGGAEGAPERAVQGQFQVGVVEHNLGVLAAHLQRDRLERSRGVLGHQRTHRAGPRKADGAHIRVLHQRLPHRRAGSGDDIDHPRRQAGIHQRLHQVIGRERRVGGRLDDAGIAANQRREELPRGDGHGKIPRRNEPYHSHRHADAHGKLVLKF